MAVVRNIQNNDLYVYEGDDVYRNMRTGKSGKIDHELAQKVLKINLEATQLLNEHPMIEELIRTLSLKIEK